MRVPFYDHAKLYRRRKAEIDGAIARVLDSGKVDWGDEVPAFEAAFAAWLGARRAVGVNSGTAALKVALLALGIGPGDEVITVPNTDIASSSAISTVGAVPVWVDVDPVSLTLDPVALAAAITPRTRAILPVDLYGHPADLEAIGAIAARHGLPVVEDACLALGATLNGRKIGTLSTVTCFSFSPSKHLGSLGSGGACVTDDDALADRMEKIAAYGQSRARHQTLATFGQLLHHETEGLNERLDEIQAAILRIKLADLEETLAIRRTQAALYDQGLAALPVETPRVRPGACHAYRNYIVHTDDRDGVRQRLYADGIATSVNYTPPMHLQPVYGARGLGPGSFPVAERSGARLMGLPLGPHLEAFHITTVIERLGTALAMPAL